jgi:sulfite reductase alpha subunit-like flavoprotein
VRGVIYNVPPNNTEEELLSLLANQGVKTVKRFTKRGPNNTTTISTMVTLHFDTTTLPREVIIAHEVFLVKKFILRP